MRKEISYAIISGILFGLVVAFGIWKANTSLKNKNQEVKKEETTIKETTTPQAPGEIALTIAKPENLLVITQDTSLVSGLTSPNSLVLISSEEKDTLIKSQSDGSFSQKVSLISGINEILVTAFDTNGKSVLKKVILVRSSEFESNKKTVASPSASPKSTASAKSTESPIPTTTPDSVREKVEEKIEKASSVARAYLGTITDISENTIQINKYSFDQGAKGEINQVATDSNTTYIKSLTNENKNINFSDLAIGDFVIAMGYVNGNSVLTAKRISVTEAPKPTTRKTLWGLITKIQKTTITLSIPNISDIYILKTTKQSSYSTIEDQKIINIDFDTFEKDQTVLVSGLLTDSTMDVRIVHLIVQEKTPESETSPTRKETETPIPPTPSSE